MDWFLYLYYSEFNCIIITISYSSDTIIISHPNYSIALNKETSFKIDRQAPKIYTQQHTFSNLNTIQPLQHVLRSRSSTPRRA
jgi:hypothetical protein